MPVLLLFKPLFQSIIFGVALLLACSGSALAQFSGVGTRVGFSNPVPPICNVDVRMTRSGPTPDRQGAPIDIDAGSVDLERFGQSEFVDSVVLTRADQEVRTGRLLWNRSIGQVVLPEALQYSDQDYLLEAENATYITDNGTAQFNQVEFSVIGSTANGHADSLQIEADGIALVKRADFTTCTGESPDWELLSNQVTLDQEAGIGVARNATLKFQDIPIFWIPWISFPLNDQRKSGFLYPNISTTSDNGFGLAVPYYWNIAPNQDATITPRILSDRGAGLGAEYRFLTPRFGGVLDGDFLLDDSKANGSNRYRYRAELGYQISPRWQARLNLQRVSDDEFFLDFGSDINETATPFLRSALNIFGSGKYWQANIVADDFQTLDNTLSASSEPFSRLPRAEFLARWPLLGNNLDFVLESEAVYFERNAGVTGARIDLTPSVEWRYEKPGWYFAPTAGFRYTAYALDNIEESAFTDDTPSRSLPIVTVDSGLIFERPLKQGGRITLEPRVFYAYVPFEDQTDLPDFDTSELTFGIAQLFTPNQFIGADRQSATNQVSWALTSRYTQGSTGRQLLDVTIGQTIFLRDQPVQLPGQPETDFESSPLLAEVNYLPFSNWAVTAGIQYDPEDNEVDVGLLGISYQGKNGFRVQGGYRFRNGSVNQFDVRARYPISARWNILGRWNFSFLDNETLETVAGFEYESCCWAVQFIGRQFVNARDGSDQVGVFLELHFKGLGSLGRGSFDLFGINQRTF